MFLPKQYKNFCCLWNFFFMLWFFSALEKPFKVLYQDMDYKHFAKEIMNCANHWNFMAYDDKKGPMILSIGIRTFSNEEDKDNYSLIGELRTKTVWSYIQYHNWFTRTKKREEVWKREKESGIDGVWLLLTACLWIFLYKKRTPKELLYPQCFMEKKRTIPEMH